MRLNAKTCKEITISFLQNQDEMSRLYMDEQPLELVSSFKLLGLTINNKLKWDDNINFMVKKASKHFYILRVLSRNGVSSSDLLLIYISLVRSILEYAYPVWHTNLPRYLSEKVELVQKRAMRIIYPGFHYIEVSSIAKCLRFGGEATKLMP